MTVFPITIPWNCGVITAELDGGLLVDPGECELDARAQTLCRAVVYFFATRSREGRHVLRRPPVSSSSPPLTKLGGRRLESG